MQIDLSLNGTEVSEMTAIPFATLRWRHQGTGQRSFKLGPRKVMHKESDVLADRQYNADQVTA